MCKTCLLKPSGEGGISLVECAGVRPLSGIKTGLNEACLRDMPTREHLVCSSRCCVGRISNAGRLREPTSG